MEITEVRISRRAQGEAKLKGYAAVTFDDSFVVRDLKIIEGKNGLFVAMPSQKMQEACPRCRKKNAIRSHFCNECGHRLQHKERRDRKEIHRDIAHPVTSDMRAYLQKVIIDAYHANQGSNHEEENGEAFREDEEIEHEEKHREQDYLSSTPLKVEERMTKEDDSKQTLLDTIE
ncbi:MAG: SpoVG family protein [Candidatus Aureabacteria bacterium]|nr:SpoVG family protein [Candidatus Auribacterota bacterium]